MQPHTKKPLRRRSILKGAGAVAIGLPLLEAMSQSTGTRLFASSSNEEVADHPPKRFVAIAASLGFHAPFLFPSAAGDSLNTPYLKHLSEVHEQLTVFSGLSHPEQQGNNGHASELTWLTAAQRPGLAGFRNSISLDQTIANKVGMQTRFPFLSLSTGGRGLSWSANGVEIPSVTSPAKLFKELFIDGTEQEKKAEVRRLRRGLSILDSLVARTQQLEGKLSVKDRQKIDEYLVAIRDLEKRILQTEGWVDKPKPKVEIDPPQDIRDKNEAIARQELLYDLIALALQTDSTRTITFQLSGLNSVPKIQGVSSDWHGLSHHGKDPDKIAELQRIEEAEFSAFGRFLQKLNNLNENGQSLLNSTSVLFGSNLGNASAHDWRNLPILVAGGGFKHSGYVAHDSDNNTPLSNLFVVLAQHLGLEIDQFGSSSAAHLRGLEA